MPINESHNENKKERETTMSVVYLTKAFDLKADEKTILAEVEDRDSDGTRKIRLPAEGVSTILVFEDGTLTTKLLGLCSKRGIRVIFFDHYGWYRGSFEPEGGHEAGAVLLQQASAALDPMARLDYAKRFVEGSAKNAERILRKKGYGSGAELSDAANRISDWSSKAMGARSIEELMGFEGEWRGAYYEAWRLIHPDLDFLPRARRPPSNPVNCMISFLNQMCYAETRNALAKTNLSDKIGFLHSSKTPNRSSLSLDVAEVFKPILVDRMIFRLAGLGQAKSGWFEQQDGICLLSVEGRDSLIRLWKEQMDETFSGFTWRTWLAKEAWALERSLLGLKASYEPFRIRA